MNIRQMNSAYDAAIIAKLQDRKDLTGSYSIEARTDGSFLVQRHDDPVSGKFRAFVGRHEDGTLDGLEVAVFRSGQLTFADADWSRVTATV
jgi:hypothetical protein